jgi:hypothetical protein
MKPDISEFSYGFALTSELVDRYGVRPAGAPIFLNLQEEGQPGGGYDVEIPAIAIFLQFKLSHRLERGSALHAGTVGIPHYRFELRPLKHSDQHNLLLELEGAGNEVYYAAPEFHQAPELNARFAASTIAANTAFFSPVDIGQLPDEDEHFVAFQAGISPAWTFSDPRELPRHTEDMIFGLGLKARLSASPQGHTLREFLHGLGDTMVDVYEKAAPRMRRHIADVSSFRALRTLSDPGRYANFVSHTLFGCQVLILARQT